MPDRKTFIKTAALALGTTLVARNQDLAEAAATPKPASKAAPAKPTPAKPTPAASAPPPPSPLARELAKSLQRDLPKTKLSDEMTEKIAGDIEGNFVIPKAFRKLRRKDLPAPDFVFRAEPDSQS